MHSLDHLEVFKVLVHHLLIQNYSIHGAASSLADHITQTDQTIGLGHQKFEYLFLSLGFLVVGWGVWLRMAEAHAADEMKDRVDGFDVFLGDGGFEVADDFEQFVELRVAEGEFVVYDVVKCLDVDVIRRGNK
jgi:hypothetical protein